MASKDGAASSQRSILTLDKSEEPFKTQIDTACAILDIDLHKQWLAALQPGKSQPFRPNTTSDPRPAHALKWLLKKLQSTEGTPSPCLFFRAWLLLRELLLRTSLITSARLLKEYKLINSLQGTFQWLQKNLTQEQLDSSPKDGTSSELDESSYDTIDSSANEQTTARKRRLDGTEIIPKHSSEGTIFALDTFYVAICGVVTQLVGLVIDPEHVCGYAVEHMRAALKSSSEEAASVLGGSLNLLNHILQNPKRSRHWNCMERRTFESRKGLVETAFESYISPIIEFWNLRSLGGHSLLDDSIDRAFMDHCVPPSLHLLQTLGAWVRPKDEVNILKASIEGLLIKHILLPFRTSSGLASPNKEQKEELLIAFVDSLATSMRKYCFHQRGLGLRADGKTKTHLIISCLSILFNIAVRCRPRNTPKLRRTEDLWLEALFSQILGCASNVLDLESSTYARKDLVRLTKRMLRGAVDHKLILSITRLESILKKASGLLSDEADTSVEWGLVSLCLLDDPNTFVIPLATSKDSQHRSHRSSNQYLAALMSHITEESCKMSSGTENDYEFKLCNILLPLVQAFADARDLNGFMAHWKEQLHTVQKQRDGRKSPLEFDLSIWEDERLLRSVAHLVESRLTAGQIDQVLSNAASDLITSIPDALNGGPVSLASLVLLDCVCNGVSQEDILAKSAETAQSLYGLLGIILSDPSNQAQKYRWRIWRIKATITDRWSIQQKFPAFEREADSAICNAFVLLNQSQLSSTPKARHGLTEELHAYSFILRFAKMEDCFWQESKFSSRQRIGSAIGTLLDLMEPLCHSISHDHLEIIKADGSIQKIDTSISSIESVDSLYLECVLFILSSPNILSCLNETFQFRLIEQLYWCAVYQQRSLVHLSAQSTDYSLPWNCLCNSCTLIEIPNMKENLRNFQVDHYLNISNSGDAKLWNMRSADYTVAFQSIQHLPPGELEPEQRSNLANRILRILLLANASSLAQTRDHLDTLTKLISIPNKNMDILSRTSDILPKYAKQASDVALITLARGIDGFTKWSSENVETLEVVKRLARSVMRYLTSTLDQQSSIEYVQVLYEELAALLEAKYKNKESCTSAFSAVAESSLTSFSQNRAKFPESLKQALGTLDISRHYHLEIILRFLENIGADQLVEPENRHICGVNLESMVGYADLLMIHPRLREISYPLSDDRGLHALLEGISEQEPAVYERDCCSADYLSVRLARLEMVLGVRDSALHPSLADAIKLLGSLQSSRGKRNLLGYLEDTIPALGVKRKKELCFEHDLERKECLNYTELVTLKIAVSSLEDPQAEELRSTLSQVVVLLVRGMATSTDFRESILTMQCINLFLQKHPRIISQWHVDSLLSAITSKGIELEARTDNKHSAMLYTGLCRVFGTILTMHRAKIGGRYHLVLPALQALLRCLYTSYSPNSGSSEPSSAFTETHTSAYARLLSTLCDPTVSSVTRSRKRSRLELNDETKKARSIAGQLLPYLIMEYCSCQLKGRLEPEMKAALNPGLYAVLDVMSQEGMRTMNAAFDESGTAVWKVLYEDWRRFGKQCKW